MKSIIVLFCIVAVTGVSAYNPGRFCGRDEPVPRDDRDERDSIFGGPLKSILEILRNLLGPKSENEKVEENATQEQEGSAQQEKPEESASPEESDSPAEAPPAPTADGEAPPAPTDGEARPAPTDGEARPAPAPTDAGPAGGGAVESDAPTDGEPAPAAK